MCQILLFTSCSLFLTITLFSVSEELIKSDGKAVLITGCDSGFGNGLALELNRLGFQVYATVLNNNSDGALHLKSKAIFPENMLIFQMDVTLDDDINNVYAKVKSSPSHKLWAIVNNAGIGSYSPLEWQSLDKYQKVFEVNVFGVVRVTRAFLPLIRASKGKLSGIYCMSKHATLAFSDVLRQEVSRFGVKVSTIEPGFTKTGLFSLKSLDNVLEESWNITSDEVKQSYQSYENEIQYTKNLFSFDIISDNMNGVIEDIVNSIVNLKPLTTYRPISIFYKIILFLNLYFPTKFTDWLIKIAENFSQNLL